MKFHGNSEEIEWVNKAIIIDSRTFICFFAPQFMWRKEATNWWWDGVSNVLQSYFVVVEFHMIGLSNVRGHSFFRFVRRANGELVKRLTTRGLVGESMIFFFWYRKRWLQKHAYKWEHVWLCRRSFVSCGVECFSVHLWVDWPSRHQRLLLFHACFSFFILHSMSFESKLSIKWITKRTIIRHRKRSSGHHLHKHLNKIGHCPTSTASKTRYKVNRRSNIVWSIACDTQNHTEQWWRWSHCYSA